MDSTNICRACLSLEDQVHLLDWYQPIESLALSYKECFCKCTQINLSWKDDPDELDDSRMRYLCFDCAQKLKDAYDFIEKARKADNELRCTQKEKVKKESLASTFEWVPIDEELIEVNKPKDPVDMHHMEDIRVPPELNQHFVDADETSVSNDVENETNIDSKFGSAVTTTTTKFLIESDKHRQSGNNLDEAGLLLSKESEQLNPALTSSNDFKKRNKVKSQVKTKSKIKNMADPVKREECEKAMTRNSLKNHRNRQKPKTFLCQACPKTFKYSSALKNHELCHNENRKRFPCDKCNQTFLTPRTYKNHRLTHENNRKPAFHCSQCGKSFLHKHSLAIHEIRHKGATIECQICEKRYVRKIDLDVHLRTHAGEPSFVCHLCGKSFIHKRVLNSHMQCHGYFSYKCLICGSKFSKYDQYYNHRMQHTGLPYKCGICDKQFPNAYKIKRHIRGVHKIEEETEVQKHVAKINVTREYRGRIAEVLENPEDEKTT